MTDHPDNESITADAKSCKVTFNLPAQKRYFDDEGATFIRLKIENDEVMFRPVATAKGRTDVSKITERGRGGLEAGIGGQMGEEVSGMLAAASTELRPFFLLSRNNQGWLRVKHYNEDGAPKKTEPHMRYWMRKEYHAEPSASARLAALLEQSNADVAEQYANTISMAATIMRDFKKSRLIGRPPTEVRSARNIMHQFEALARVHLSHLFVTAATLTPLNDALTSLSGFISMVNEHSAAFEAHSDDSDPEDSPKSASSKPVRKAAPAGKATPAGKSVSAKEQPSLALPVADAPTNAPTPPPTPVVPMAKPVPKRGRPAALQTSEPETVVSAEPALTYVREPDEAEAEVDPGFVEISDDTQQRRAPQATGRRQAAPVKAVARHNRRT